jgi:NitT/TauT family transport system ATP-binding protein
MIDNSNNSKLEVKDLSISFTSKTGNQVLAVDKVSLSIQKHDFVALIGPSGCGKTTILNAMAGLVRPDSGAIFSDGEEVLGVNKKIGYISQIDSLLPWTNVINNIALGLELRGVKKSIRYQEARRLIEMIGLTGFEKSYPHELSGGMKKRVTIASVLAIDPDILFMDEPFGPLDAFTKALLQDDILKIWQESNKTIVYVTHDLQEAISLADRVILVGARPAQIRGDYRIDLPRPRNLMEIKFDPKFIDLERIIWNDLREEIEKTRGDLDDEE